MSIYLSNLILILFLIYIYRTNRHGLHILQLEHYYKDRYVKWMKENANTIFDVKKVGLLFLSSLIFGLGFIKAGYIVTIVTYVTLILSFHKNREKKPFVKTARVKRQYISYFILAIILILMINVFNDVYSIIVLNILAMLTYCLVYAIATINKPIENSIKKRY